MTTFSLQVMMSRVLVVLLSPALLMMSGCDRGHSIRNPESSGAPAWQSAPGLRMTMEELHKVGGVPPGWLLQPPLGDPARGREAFVRFGCHRCHRVANESFPDEITGPGPDLTGMGSHHPPAYFVEAILNPNAILIDGPEYIAADGTSRMPSYPDMTLAELVDLVSYLVHLREPSAGVHAHHPGASEELGHGHHHHSAHGGSGLEEGQLAYLLQAYAVREDQLDRLYQWFEQNDLNKAPGLVRVDTFASRERDPQLRLQLVALFAFENEAAARRFLEQQEHSEIGTYLRPAAEASFQSPVLFPVQQLSSP